MQDESARELLRLMASSLLGIEVRVLAVSEGEKVRFDILVPRTFVSRAIGRRGETARAMHHLVRESMKQQPFTLRIAAIEDARITVENRPHQAEVRPDERVWN